MKEEFNKFVKDTREFQRILLDAPDIKSIEDL